MHPQMIVASAQRRRLPPIGGVVYRVSRLTCGRGRCNREQVGCGGRRRQVLAGGVADAYLDPLVAAPRRGTGGGAACRRGGGAVAAVAVGRAVVVFGGGAAAAMDAEGEPLLVEAVAQGAGA